MNQQYQHSEQNLSLDQSERTELEILRLERQKFELEKAKFERDRAEFEAMAANKMYYNAMEHTDPKLYRTGSQQHQTHLNTLNNLSTRDPNLFRTCSQQPPGTPAHASNHMGSNLGMNNDIYGRGGERMPPRVGGPLHNSSYNSVRLRKPNMSQGQTSNIDMRYAKGASLVVR